MLKQKLSHKLLQKLSPQQIQMIKLLEIPTVMLEQRVKQELEENPVLESGREDDESPNENDDQDDFSIDEYIQDEIPSYKLSAQNYSKDDKKEDIPFSVSKTFHDELKRQLGLRRISDEKKELAQYILGNIDDDGYLRRELSAIKNDLIFSANISTTEEALEEVLFIIQSFDPPGIGARSLKECLLIQLDNKEVENADVQLAIEILEKSYDEFTKKHYDKIISKHNISELQLKDALDVILHLNPKPGGSLSEVGGKPNPVIVPDFMLEIRNGELELSMNTKNVPELKISRTYADMLDTYSKSKDHNKQDKEAITFVKQKLDSAKWFIDAIKQRQNTLQITMQSILEYQYDYFLEGDETRMRPMILKDIAEITGLDISTISRVANSKYIQTHFGIHPLKYFFSEGIMNESGEEVSTREIKKILQDCVDNEDKKKPLTDDKLAVILKEKGYSIARRTAAKYREQLNIPVARLRKNL